MSRYFNLKWIFLVLILFLIPCSFSIAQSSQHAKYNILNSYSAGGKKWINVLISKKLSKQELINIARQLHQEHPHTFFHFFDDNSKINEYVQWDMYYPNPNYPYPEKWVDKHLKANINKMFTREGLQWQLIEPFGSKIVALE